MSSFIQAIGDVVEHRFELLRIVGFICRAPKQRGRTLGELDLVG
jgi:hypothetical protein